jgi:hypothetical protein
VYFDALSFLEDERDAWRPFEALERLTDEQLSRPIAGAHGWSGRDLMAHLAGWLASAAVNARTDDDKTLVLAVRPAVLE